MLKKIWKCIKPESIIKKCIWGIISMSLVMLVILEIFLKSFMFQMIEPELLNNFSVLTSAVSSKVSYILHQNSQYILHYWKDDEILNNTLRYIEQKKRGREKQAEIFYDSILGELKKEEMGAADAGSITSSRNIFLLADEEYLFANAEMDPYAQQILKSKWFSEVTGILEKLHGEYQGYDLERCYSPVFEKNESADEFIAFVVPKEKNGHKILFIMVEPFKDYRNILYDFNTTKITDYCILGYENEILFQNEDESIVEEVLGDTKDLEEGVQYETIITKNHGNYMMAARASYPMDQIEVAIGIRMEDILRQYIPIIETVKGCMIFFMFLLAGLLFVILKKSFEQLQELSGQMSKIQNGEYQFEKRIQSQDEIGVLAKTFYNMAAEIQNNLKRIRQQEEREKRIEYSLLLSQINPHLIYNTLNTITFLAQMNETGDIVVLNKALIEMLQDRLRMSRLQIFDTLEEEKKQIDSYITIQNYLCRNKVEYEFSLDEKIRLLSYPKNILQPFVENSILHGILLNKDASGTPISGIIKVSIYQKNEKIITEIDDNGIGMDANEIQHYFYEEPERLDVEAAVERKNYKHIGIYNIRMRLNYLYGDSVKLHAEKSGLGGLKIYMEFPNELQKKQEV